MKSLKKINKNLDNLKKEKFYLLLTLFFIFFLFLGLILGLGIKNYRLYKLRQYRIVQEKEFKERLNKKLEKYQVKIKIEND